MDMLYDVIDKLESKEESQVTDADPALLKEKLKAIQNACAALNKKIAKKTLEELKKGAWSSSTNELLSKISGLLLHSDFEEAAKAIDDYVKQLQP
jgi:hypothetical protein